MEIIIDNTINHTLQDDDVISLRDMQLYDQTATSSTRSSPRASSGHELFEFYPNPPSPTAAATFDDVIFCGKVISTSDRMLVGSSSLRLPERSTEHVIPVRSVSNRDLGSPRHGGVRVSTSGKKVNVTATKSKRWMFIFGPVPEMEMRSIKERQLRRAPSRMMFPAVAEGGGDVAKKVTGGTDKNNRVKSRARLNSVLACLRI